MSLRDVGMAPDPDQIGLFNVDPDPLLLVRSLRDDFLVPPFTVLDRRQGYWQERRRAWLNLGIASEIGRSDGLAFNIDYQYYRDNDMKGWTTPHAATSVFDPLLCELAYQWFCPRGGIVLDPFAGGSVRGIVAAALERQYCGIDLRQEQVEANRQQAREILTTSAVSTPLPLPQWTTGDSAAVLIAPQDHNIPIADLVFTCPPYGDLEVYSDDPRDLSTMAADDFDEYYAHILAKSIERLADDRFAVMVVGNVRGKNGMLRDLSGLTVRAMDAAGAGLYNAATLIDPIGTAAVRAPKQFVVSRKLVCVHQSILVFVKGDPRVATEAIEAAHARG